MKNEFVIYEQALALKELGFNEPCFGVFQTQENNRLVIQYFQKSSLKVATHLLPAPTFSQCFKWFRDNYDLKAYIIPIEYLDGTQETYQWNIFNECHSGVEQLTYEEAEQACLDKLIELVKNK